MAAYSRVRRDVRLTPSQALHEQVMKELLSRVQDLGMVLKGGSVLAFTRGLNRHSTDLDFDTDRAVELRDRIESAARAVGVGLGPVKRADWSRHQRFSADYPYPFEVKPGLLKVDVHFRHAPNSKHIELIEGIRTYKVPALFDQKLAATASRIEPRDLFDLAFVMERFGDSLRDDQIRRAEAFTQDLNRLEQRYKNRFEQDEILSGISTVDDAVLTFRYATTGQRDLRWPRVQEQRAPVPVGVLGRVFVIQNRARIRARGGSQPRDRRTGGYQSLLRRSQDPARKRARESSVDLDWSVLR